MLMHSYRLSSVKLTHMYYNDVAGVYPVRKRAKKIKLVSKYAFINFKEKDMTNQYDNKSSAPEKMPAKLRKSHAVEFNDI